MRTTPDRGGVVEVEEDEPVGGGQLLELHREGSSPTPGAAAARTVPRSSAGPPGAARPSRRPRRQPDRSRTEPVASHSRPVVEQVALEASASPEGEGIAGVERLTDHRHLAAGHRGRASARRSGRGRRMSGKARTGMVDHRFDHIDSGRLPSAGARAYGAAAIGHVHLASPHAAQRPLPDRRSPCRRAAARATGRACGASGLTANVSQRVAWRSTVVVSASHVVGATPGHATSSGMWPISGKTGTDGLPHVPRSPR